MQDQINRLALRISLLYVLIAGLWILFSDRVVAAFFSDSTIANRIQTFKGFGFVVVTAWLLFRVLRRYLSRWGAEVEEHRKGEAALRESEERYRLLAENASDVIWIRDLNLKCTYISPSIEKLTGYSVEEAMALPLEASYTPDSIAKNMKVLQKELALENDQKCDPFRVRKIGRAHV